MILKMFIKPFNNIQYWMLPKKPIISRNVSSKNCSKWIFLRKTQWVHVSISFRSGARGSKDCRVKYRAESIFISFIVCLEHTYVPWRDNAVQIEQRSMVIHRSRCLASKRPHNWVIISLGSLVRFQYCISFLYATIFFTRQTKHFMYYLLQHEYCLSVLYLCPKIVCEFSPWPELSSLTKTEVYRLDHSWDEIIATIYFWIIFVWLIIVLKHFSASLIILNASSEALQSPPLSTCSKIIYMTYQISYRLKR